MSVDASRARSVGPFVQTVASATWFCAIEGFFSSRSSGSTLGSQLGWQDSQPCSGQQPSPLTDCDCCATFDWLFVCVAEFDAGAQTVLPLFWSTGPPFQRA